ncbi:unnamed protein product [Arabis nemorensis]|uniref:SAM-dependent methyltransferase RsmB-F/NOP2-type catalytic core domain-containing protein n=1 Tax=Arabis nemorensis TaxID=586526 RepID=A0A565C843_9BRAS|nr:unnamed protein product [Arabis nemorensis]
MKILLKPLRALIVNSKNSLNLFRLSLIFRERRLDLKGTLPCSVFHVGANDVDYKRCNLLIHQTKRTCTTNMIVTNNEGQHFPNCNSKTIDHIDQLLFDRNVPCSGDGTLRKAPGIWRRWLLNFGASKLTFVDSNCFNKHRDSSYSAYL